MLDNTKTETLWCELRISPDNPYLDLIEQLREDKKAPLLRELKEELWQAECDLIPSEDTDNDPWDDIDRARDRLRSVRYILTLLLGDTPDDLLHGWAPSRLIQQ